MNVAEPSIVLKDVYGAEKTADRSETNTPVWICFIIICIIIFFYYKNYFSYHHKNNVLKKPCRQWDIKEQTIRRVDKYTDHRL